MSSRYYDAIFNRCSIRSFKGGLTPKIKQSLQEFADDMQNNGMGEYGIRIAICTSNRVFSKQFFHKSITGTDTFAAIISKYQEDMFVGYFGEHFVLECTARGIGTCWLGLSYKKNAVDDVLTLDDGENVECIIALGTPAEDYVQRERKSVTELTGYRADEYRSLPQWQKSVIECGRLAPSSMNAQPWKFHTYSDAVSIELAKNNHGFELIDCGIAMLHMELGAKAENVDTTWDISDDDRSVLVLAENENELEIAKRENSEDEQEFSDMNMNDFDPDDEALEAIIDDISGLSDESMYGYDEYTNSIDDE